MPIRPLLVSAAFASALALPAAALAQQAPPAAPATTAPQGAWGHGRGHGGFMRMFRTLNLSDQQKTQIQQIVQQYRQAHPEGSAPDRQSREQMRQQVMNVLTPQQRQQLQTEMQQMRERRGERDDDGGATPQPQSTPEP